MSKTIVIVGVTGVQGGSVAQTFLHLPGWKVRGISRNPASSAAKSLTQAGVEVVRADLDDKDSLLEAFTGANLIFANTDFFMHLFGGAESEDLLQGRTPQQYAYDREVEQGVNIAEVAALPVVLETLERFIWSSLCDVQKLSNGKYTEAYHYDSKNEVIQVIEAQLPELAKRMSLLQMGHYVTNWYTARDLAPQKQSDGSFVVNRPFRPDGIVAFVVAQNDTGKFVEALYKAPTGTHLQGVSEKMTWPEYTEIWGRVLGVRARHQYVPYEEFFAGGHKALVDEMRQPFAFVDEFGYDGGDSTVVSPKQLGIKELTGVEQYIREEDWTSVL